MKINTFFATLQQRMRAMIIFSIMTFLVVSLFSLWNIKEFHSHRQHIENSSLQLQNNLQQNFNASRILGDIHSNLRLYMQSADPDVLATIRKDTETLQDLLPKDMPVTLVHLREIIETLAIRMNSLRENNKQIIKAQLAVSNALLIIQRKVAPALFSEIYPLSRDVMIQHQQIYVSSIITGQINEIRKGQLDTQLLITGVEDKFTRLIEKTPKNHHKLIKDLQDGFYWLDEASTTVAAIRITTLETEQEIVDAVDSLKIAIAENSLNRNEESVVLTEEGLSMAKENILFLISILAVLSILLIITSLITNRNMVHPLVNFVGLLRNLGRMMTGQRKQSYTDDEHLQQLSQFIDARRDEIGEVAMAMREVLTGLQDISFFRKTIEADETTAEIYTRLARVFINKLGLDTFVFYEKLSGQASMQHVYSHPPELGQEMPEFNVADTCRAKRTGDIINSFDDPVICPIFPFHDSLEHYCIPMLVGGHVIGVIQLMFSKDISPEEKRALGNKISKAKNYIAETLPVLQSKHLARELEEMATKDQLTGLFNRRFLEASLDQLVAGVRRRGTTLGILMADLDYFKKVNDTYGHDAGDDVLKQFAALLKNAVRDADLVIRFGGEEFIIILMDCEKDKAGEISEKIRMDIEKYKFQASGNTIQKTTSIGVSEFPAHATQGIWEAIKFADVALYKAKENGRNRTEVFNAEMWERSGY